MSECKNKYIAPHDLFDGNIKAGQEFYYNQDLDLYVPHLAQKIIENVTHGLLNIQAYYGLPYELVKNWKVASGEKFFVRHDNGSFFLISDKGKLYFEMWPDIEIDPVRISKIFLANSHIFLSIKPERISLNTYTGVYVCDIKVAIEHALNYSNRG